MKNFTVAGGVSRKLIFLAYCEFHSIKYLSQIFVKITIPARNQIVAGATKPHKKNGVN